MTTLSRAPDDAACTPPRTPADHAIGSDAADVVAATLKALADPLRLRMLSAIATTADGEACVCDLAELADVSQPTVSHHLKVLAEAKLVTREQRGRWAWFSADPERLQVLADALQPGDTAAR